MILAATSTLLIEAVLARFLGWPGMLTLAAAAGLAAIPTTFAVDASLRILSPASRPGMLELGAETLVINLVLTFAVPGISWQGHIGGLITGALIAAVFV